MATSKPNKSVKAVKIESTIPLTCTACPKKAKFSDVSHLLTHLNSKGHLQAHQQLKIRSRNDTSASTTLLQYDQWYDDNGIEKLLADRLAQRDEKDAGRKREIRDGPEPVSLRSAFQGTERH